MELAVPLKLILAFILGGVIGFEREINEKKAGREGKSPTAVLGLRSFSLITGLGALVGLLLPTYEALALLLSAVFMLLLLVFYILDTRETKDTGVTTELAIIYSFVIGIILMIDLIPIQLILALTVFLILLLSRKEEIKAFVRDVRREQVNAFIGYAIIALVILPFLPNKAYALSDIPGLISFLQTVGIEISKLQELELVNPFKLWFIVALITGVDVVGYILERTIGQKKGWLLASVIGGLISSTATTQSLAKQSKESKQVNHLIAAAIFANAASFFQIAFLIISMNILFFFHLLPSILSLIVAACCISLFFLFQKERQKSHRKTDMQEQVKDAIFDIGPALKFAFIFFMVSIVSKIAYIYFGETGFLFASGLAALTGIDAVMINTASLAGRSIEFQLGLWAFVLANGVNLLSKSVYSFLLGSREFGIKLTLSMLALIGASLLGVLFI